jgi:hypothetical protein
MWVESFAMFRWFLYFDPSMFGKRESFHEVLVSGVVVLKPEGELFHCFGGLNQFPI